MTDRKSAAAVPIPIASAAAAATAAGSSRSGGSAVASTVNGVEQLTVWMAATRGDVKYLKELMSAASFVGVNACDAWGRTAMHWAALSGHASCVELLLARGANPNAIDEDGWTPLHFACNNSHRDVMTALLACQSVSTSIPDRSSERRTAFEYLPPHEPRLSGWAPAKPRPPLSELANLNVWDAVERGEVHWLQSRLARHMTEFRAAEHLSANPPPKLKPWQERERAQELENAKRNGTAPPPVQPLPPLEWTAGIWGRTPLHYAAITGNAVCAHLILRCRADPNAADDSGWTPLHWASNGGHTAVVRLLLMYHAHRNVRNCEGRLPIELAKNGILKQARRPTAAAALLTARRIVGVLVAGVHTLLSCTTPDVLVMGAGAAAIAVAHTLMREYKWSADRIQLIEARDRIGGRAHSVMLETPASSEPAFSSQVIDAGGQWIHGFNAENPITKLAAELKVPVLGGFGGSWTLYDSEDKRSPAQEISREIVSKTEHWWRALIHQATERQQTLRNKRERFDVSVKRQYEREAAAIAATAKPAATAATAAASSSSTVGDVKSLPLAKSNGAIAAIASAAMLIEGASASSVAAAGAERFEFQRLSDSVRYSFERKSGSGKTSIYVRSDGAVSVVFDRRFGWSTWDSANAASGVAESLTSRAWDVAVADQTDFPPPGIWVSRKGDKSYVYLLTYSPAPTATVVATTVAGVPAAPPVPIASAAALSSAAPTIRSAPPPVSPAADAVDESFWSAIEPKFLKLTKSATPEEKRCLWFYMARNEQYEGGSLAKQSVMMYDWADSQPGGDASVPSGYGNIIKRLSAGISVALSSTVRAVEYGAHINPYALPAAATTAAGPPSGSSAALIVDNSEEATTLGFGGGVRITTANGRQFSAPYAVCTLPLGILKTSEVGFNPSLPGDKTQAIQRLGLGLMNKVFLMFPKRFWDDESAIIGVATEVQHSFHWFYNFHHESKKNILIAFYCCDFAWEAEKLTDAVILTKVMDRLKRAFGEKLVPKPVAYHITRWASDPFARMSYTYFGVGASERDTDAFTRPCDGAEVDLKSATAVSAVDSKGAALLPPPPVHVDSTHRLGFAGEHTTAADMGTIHGAWSTGAREAHRIRRHQWSTLAARCDRAVTRWMQANAKS